MNRCKGWGPQYIGGRHDSLEPSADVPDAGGEWVPRSGPANVPVSMFPVSRAGLPASDRGLYLSIPAA
jgi:hypothetical protein